MRNTLLLLSLLLCVHAEAIAQAKPLPDTLLVGTVEYREFEKALYGLRKIRLHTSRGIYELLRPEFSPAGFTYGAAESIGGNSTAHELLDPIPFADVRQIDVRRGHAAIGALAGFGMGFLLGWAFCESGGIAGDCVNNGVAGIGVGALGALIGLTIGESVHSWKPLYKDSLASSPIGSPSICTMSVSVAAGGA